MRLEKKELSIERLKEQLKQHSLHEGEREGFLRSLSLQLSPESVQILFAFQHSEATKTLDMSEYQRQQDELLVKLIHEETSYNGIRSRAEKKLESLTLVGYSYRVPVL